MLFSGVSVLTAEPEDVLTFPVGQTGQDIFGSDSSAEQYRIIGVNRDGKTERKRAARGTTAPPVVYAQPTIAGRAHVKADLSIPKECYQLRVIEQPDTVPNAIRNEAGQDVP
jgi:hypothetical protein